MNQPLRALLIVLNVSACSGDALRALRQPEKPKAPEAKLNPTCETVSCAPDTTYVLVGDNGWTGTKTCVESSYPSVVESCCEGPAACATRRASVCAETETIIASAGICQRIDGCSEGAPVIDTAPDGTPCGDGKTCQDGVCTSAGIEASVGCADHEREGYLDTAAFPNIAACSGAWSDGGLTASALLPRCGREGGDDGLAEGSGCSAEDLCADGWHVCHGKDDVTTSSPSGCDGAVPAGAPDKSLLFVVSQHSVTNMVCDASSGDNDVFGCGNLGHTLAADKGCAPLNRALGSMNPGSCGYNEAEPPLGPFACSGSDETHLHEGGIVRKNGCPGGSCSYDGHAVGSADKGGVLCCRD